MVYQDGLGTNARKTQQIRRFVCSAEKRRASAKQKLEQAAQKAAAAEAAQGDPGGGSSNSSGAAEPVDVTGSGRQRKAPDRLDAKTLQSGYLLCSTLH